MDMQRLVSELPEGFTSTVVDTIRYAYRENAPYQDPALGHDEWTFSILVFATLRRLLPARLGQEEITDLRIVQEQNTMSFTWHGLRFFVKKVGRAASDDPWNALPSRSSYAGFHGGQMVLDFGGESAPGGFVFGHYGTLRDGLGAVRLHAIGDTTAEGRITRWDDWTDLWVSPSVGSDHTVARVDAVDVPEPQLDIKRPAANADDATAP